MQKQCLFLSAALIAFGFSLSAPAPARADDLVCGSWPISSGTGLAVKQSKARDRARHKWGTKIFFSTAYGPKYRHWELSRDPKGYECHKKHGTWRCVAFAKPCRLK